MSKAYYLMEDTVYEQTLLLSDEVLDAIYDFFDVMAGDDFIDHTVKAGKTNEWEQKMNNTFDEVINAMREDLAFDKLDKGLKGRIGAKHHARKVVTAADAV